MVAQGKSAPTWGMKIGIAGVSAFALSAVALGLGSGIASADDISADSGAANANPSAEDGVRTSGYNERSSVQGEVSDPIRAVPGTAAGSPGPGDLSAGLPVCLFYWDNSCG